MNLLDRLPWSEAARRRRLVRAAREMWGHAPPPSRADPDIVGNAEGDRRQAERDRAAIRARLEQEHDRDDTGERDR